MLGGLICGVKKSVKDVDTKHINPIKDCARNASIMKRDVMHVTVATGYVQEDAEY